MDALDNEYVRRLILDSDVEMEKIGFFEHGITHAQTVAETTRRILLAAGFEELGELGYAAGILHDIGNVFGRRDHHLTGSTLSKYVLLNLGYADCAIECIAEAIANHIFPLYDETPPMASALLIADKVDLRRSRVRVDRNGLNRNVTKSEFLIDEEKKMMTFVVYFKDEVLHGEFADIYGRKISMCKGEAKRLGFQFEYRLVMDK